MIPFDYDLEYSRIIEEVKKNKPKRVLLHLPDGLKPKAAEIQQLIEKESDTQVLIWAGSNFGACDIPIDSERAGVDMIIHFGHSAWLS